MKELTKIQVAAIKRTNQNVKPMLKKSNTLQAKIAEMQAEIEILQSQIDAFEAPIKLLTDGYTSTEYLNFLETGTLPKEEVATEVTTPEVDNTPVQEVKTEDTIPSVVTNNVEELPFGNPTFPTEAL